MTLVSPEQIQQFRSHLQTLPAALAALNVLEDCEGDLEDAAIVLAIRAGQEPGIVNSTWLADLARRCRSFLCQPDYQSLLAAGDYGPVITQLAATPLCPGQLAALVVLYAVEQGLPEFCGSGY